MIFPRFAALAADVRVVVAIVRLAANPRRSSRALIKSHILVRTLYMAGDRNGGGLRFFFCFYAEALTLGKMFLILIR